MKIAIVGSRNYPDRDAVAAYIRKLPADTVVISGGAKGVDTWVVDHASKRGLKTIIVPAQWNLYGKRAGYLRNRQLVEEADKVVAFWNGDSPGTHHTINIADELDKPCEIITPHDN